MADKRTFNVEAIIDTVEWTAGANVVRGRAQVSLLPPWSSKDRAFEMFRPRRGKIRRIEYEDGSVDEFHVEEKRGSPDG